ncbi:MAG: WG repeat-containing protein [Bacteroidota bacterium]
MTWLVIAFAGLPDLLSQPASQWQAFKENNRWGFIDSAENIVIPNRYEAVMGFNGGAANVRRRGRWGLIDSSGKKHIRFRFDGPIWFDQEGLAIVSRKGSFGVIDREGESVLPFKFEEISAFQNGLARVVIKGKMGLTDRNESFVLPPEYDWISERPSEERWLFRKGGDWGAVERSGRFLLAEPLDSMGARFEKGWIKVARDEEVGYMNPKGELLLANRWDVLPPVVYGLTVDSLRKQLIRNELCFQEKRVSLEKAMEIANEIDFFEGNILGPDIKIEEFRSHCCWRIHTQNISTTREGECRYTNGCTVILNRDLWIDMMDGLIIHRTDQRRLYPNYE